MYLLSGYLGFSLILLSCTPVSGGAESSFPSPATLASLEGTTLPSETQTILNTVTPFILGNGLRFDSWSPDSEWLTYWISENDQESSASLGFANVLTGENCLHPEVIAQGLEGGTVIWQSDQVVVLPGTEENALFGEPCGELIPLENGTFLQANQEISPDGRFLAETTFTSEGQLIHYTVIITDTTTHEAINNFSWDASVHAVRGGPSWLTNELYLIGQTYLQGVLYLTVPDGQPGNVLRDLMGIETYDEETLWWVFSQTDPEVGEYHILLQWWGGPTEWPPLLLYHGELNLVEDLPFYKARPFTNYVSSYGFSLDGHWLLAGHPVESGNPAEDSGTDYWLRPVDPPDTLFIEFIDQATLGELSSTGQMMAYLLDNRDIHIVTFPSGELLSQWHASGYDIQNIWWSPDSNKLIALGHQPESNRIALFVIEP